MSAKAVALVGLGLVTLLALILYGTYRMEQAVAGDTQPVLSSWLTAGDPPMRMPPPLPRLQRDPRGELRDDMRRERRLLEAGDATHLPIARAMQRVATDGGAK